MSFRFLSPPLSQKVRIVAQWTGLLLLLAVASPSHAAENASAPPVPFDANPAWARASSVTWDAASGKIEAAAAKDGAVCFCADGAVAEKQLLVRMYTGDCVLRFEFLIGPDTQAGVFLQERYKVRLCADAMGAMGANGPLDEFGHPDASAVVPPAAAALENAAGAPGVWQTFEAKYRAPRFDEARNKTQHALLIEVKINGRVVQANTLATELSRGTALSWEDSAGYTTFAVDRGSFALRNVSLRIANFDPVKVPAKSGQPTNAGELIDLVQRGEQTFRGLGCIECHAVQRDDASLKTGPNLFGLFAREPKDHVVVSGGEDHRFTVKADRSYLLRSLRTPAEERAIATSGPLMGQPYLPVMPPYSPEVISSQQVDAIGAFLVTLNDGAAQGPAIWLAKEAGLENYDPIKDRLQLLVRDTLRIQRGPMEKLSGRTIHVGQTNGFNYSFDPRLLAIARVWQGGFLDMSGEFLNRGGRGLKTGYDSREINLGVAGVLCAPLDGRGEPVDLSFKGAKFRDGVAVAAALNSARDHLDMVAGADAQFLGYTRDSSDAAASPVFKYRIGRNVVAVCTEFSADGGVRMKIEGDFAVAQAFAVNSSLFGALTVSAGEVRDGIWTLPAGRHAGATAQGRVVVADKVWRPASSTFNHRRQPVVVEASQPKLPRGYRAESYLGPKDNYGRDQLFEALGLAVAPDGTLVVATRTAGVWRMANGEWRLFAEGMFDSLGVQVEDEHGLVLVVGQKAELTRMRDTNGDGLADSFETMTDAFSYHGNYHSYMHGPVRDANGDYFITLNLDDAGQVDYEYRAGGKFMGTGGGFRGWAIRVPAAGGFEPWANGLRSPASLGVAPDGRIWYADNQGEYVGTSKLFVLKKGAFYGHPAGLVDLPGMTPASPEIAWENVAKRVEPAVVLFPQSRLANSPGNPAWDTTGGKFGPFAGQMLLGDQTQSNLLRVITERVGGHEQGVAIPFATNLESGVMRPVFLADGSLLLGQTGRGWQARGGRVASLQRIVWDGVTTPPAIRDVSAVADGFAVRFTVPVPAAFSNDEVARALAIKSWVYRDAPDYGSPELDEREEMVARTELSADRTTLRVTLARLDQPRVHPQQTARVYQLTLDGKTLWGEPGPGFTAFYTLYEFPVSR